MLNKVIEFRKILHTNAEPSLKEFKTQQLLIDFILNLGISNNNIKKCGNTGLIIKLFGKNEEIDKPKNIMIRADMDALPIIEKNNLEYKSISNYSHQCGHDGHMAILIYSIYLINNNLKKIPKNASVSFLFQPGEEAHNGASIQIEDNCLKNIDEIYGLHNMPFGEPCDIFLKKGFMMTACMKYIIKFEKINENDNLDNISLAFSEFYLEVENYINNLENKNDIIICFPSLNCSRYSQKSRIYGLTRSFYKDLLDKSNNDIKVILNNICLKYNFKLNIEYLEVSKYPVDNHPELTENTIKIIESSNYKFKKIRDDLIPVLASEDFSYFQRWVPGVFLFIGIGTNPGKKLHEEEYLFNDSVIETGGNIWLEIALNQLNNI